MSQTKVQNKIGFWSVVSIVIGSQVGTGVFVAPMSLAPFGIYVIAGWILAGIGAIALSLVFASLCEKLPHTGGAHIYVQAAFGNAASFFIGWTYWVISWVSTVAVIKACIGYLTPIIGQQSKEIYLAMEIILLLIISYLNLKGASAAGQAEFILTLLKFIPLIVIPIFALPHFDLNNFVLDEGINSLPASTILGHVTLITLWGFVGLECTTTAAGSVINPSKTIPKAILLGTSTVAVIYLLNSIGVMGIISGKELILSQAPYVDATNKIFGHHMAIIISLISCIICIGTLNAWMLVSGQIALGLAESGLMPKIFAYRNQHEAPAFSIAMSALGMIPMLILTASSSFAQQVTTIIDVSVTAFLFVYLACCLAFFCLHLRSKTLNFAKLSFGLVATFFCLWVIFETPLITLLSASSFTICGVPLYFLWYRKQKIKA